MSGSSPDPWGKQAPGAPSWPSGTSPSAPLVPAPPTYPAMQPPGYPAMAPQATAPRGMYTAAAIINWVTLGIIIVVTFGFGIIAAAWFVPMTIQIHRGAKGPYKHTALGVCTLLFCSIISGILMLVDDSNRPPKPLA